jgi:putative inorganic carbon (hco3(-)) transporter
MSFERKALQSLAFYLWLACIIIPMIFWGANRPWLWPWALLGSSLCMLLTAQVTQVGKRLTQVGLGRSGLWFWALIGAWFALHLVQLLPLGRPQVGLVHDRTAVVHTLALNLHYGLIFVLTLLWTNEKRALRKAIAILLSFSVLHAAIASWAALSKISIVEESWAFNAFSTSGFFGNRNLFAGHLEMMLGLGIGMLISDMSTHTGTAMDWKDHARNLVRILLSSKAVLRLALIVLVIALVMSQSRSGNVAFFVAMTGVGVLALMILRRKPRSLWLLLISLVIIDVAVIGSWFGADRIVGSIARTSVDFSAYETSPSNTEEARSLPNAIGPQASSVEASIAAVPMSAEQTMATLERERPVLTRQTLAMWKTAPWMGVGPGGFRSNYPGFHADDQSPLFYDHAHNDYAQLLAERGVLGAIVLALLCLACMVSAVYAMARRQDSQASGLAVGTLIAMVAIALHSATDFNLRIPANATLFAVVLAFAWLSAVGLSQSEREVSSERNDKSGHRARSRSRPRTPEATEVLSAKPV